MEVEEIPSGTLVKMGNGNLGMVILDGKNRKLVSLTTGFLGFTGHVLFPSTIKGWGGIKKVLGNIKGVSLEEE